MFDDIPTEPAYELGYIMAQNEFEEKYFNRTKSGSARLKIPKKSHKHERDYFSYLHRIFYRAMMDCAQKKAATSEEHERLNQEFWKLSERVDYYKKKAIK